MTLTDEVSGKTYFAASGIIELCDPNHPCISFKDVPLCTPNGEILVQSMSFTIKVGQNVIITGMISALKSNYKIHLNDLILFKVQMVLANHHCFVCLVIFGLYTEEK